MDQKLIDDINTAVQSHNWVVLIVCAVALIVPIVLKVMGKSIPIVDTILDLAVKVVKALKPNAPPPPPKAGEPTGVAAVVKIEDASKKPANKP